MSDHFQISRYGYSASIRLGAQSIVSVFGMPTRLLMRPAHREPMFMTKIKNPDTAIRKAAGPDGTKRMPRMLARFCG